MPRSPKRTSTGWVYRDKPDTAEGFLILFAALLGLLLLVFLIIGGISWLTSGSPGTEPTVGVMVVGALLGLIVFLWAKTARVNAAWHPFEITLSAWPIVVGKPVLVEFEQRRKDPLAEAPRVSVDLRLRKSEYRREGLNRTRTRDSTPAALIEQRDLEPVKAHFELVVPSEWSQYVGVPEYSFELLVWLSFDEDGIGGSFPLEVTT